LYYILEIIALYIHVTIQSGCDQEIISSIIQSLQSWNGTAASSELRECGGGLAHLNELSSIHYRLRDHVPADCVEKYKSNQQYTITRDKLENIIHLAPQRMAHKIAKLHGITRKHNINTVELRNCFKNHHCNNCDGYVSVLEPRSQNFNASKKLYQEATKEPLSPTTFPPEPPGKELCEQIITDFCQEFDAGNIVERGCAVCGQLTSSSQLSKLSAVSNHLELLEMSGVASKERKSIHDSRADITGPILASGCNEICHSCRRSLREGKVPRMALARNLWIGDIPSELKALTFIEKLMVSRVRHNTCYATVASGAKKLRCNIISFETNLPKVYSMLPPPMSDMDSYIAVLFSSPTEPTEQTLKRTPFLV
jgi:hypothetical protein